MKVKIDKIKLIKRLVIVFLILGSITFFVANKIVKKYGYTSVFDVLQTTINNNDLSNNVDPIQLNINLSESDFEFIKQKRQVALDRGLQINEGDNYVNCKLSINNESIKGQMRLKGHMTDHLEGDKWSFRIKSKDTILGMYRFSLQHPGTRNYVYEWIYHQFLKHENVIYLKYDFINVSLNNKNLGIYAVEEHFGQHVLNRNNRPKGAIIRWNPNLYWEGRIDGYQKIYLNETYSDYKSSFAEPYDKGTVVKDKELLENYKIAISRLEKFRRAELKTSDVFDVEKMAKFHAVIDLVGGQHSLDWSDVKFYYNSETQKIEPVGYESFSIRETTSIAGQQSFVGNDKTQFSYHAQLFSDPIFFEAYIKNLERIADEKYLNQFFNQIDKALKQKKGIIAKEWPYRKFELDGYFKNVELIRHNLQLPKAFHAFTQIQNKDSIVISLAAVSDFPIEILGLKKQNKTYKLKSKFILKPKPKQTVINYIDLTFYGKFNKNKKLTVLAKIPGSKNIFEIELAKYPAYKTNVESKQLNSLKIDTSIFKVTNNVITLKHTESIINSETIIPKQYKLVIKPNQKITLNNSMLIHGELNCVGLQDNPIHFSTNKSGLCKVNGKIKAINVNFTGNQCFQLKNGEASFYNCIIYDVNTVFLNNYNSNISFNTCQTANVNCLSINNESDIYLSNCAFKKGKQLLVNNASSVKVYSINVSDYKQIANLNYQTYFGSWSSNYTDIDTLFNINNSSEVKVFGGEFSNFDVAFLIHSNSDNLLGQSNYTLYKTKTENFKNIELKL